MQERPILLHFYFLQKAANIFSALTLEIAEFLQSWRVLFGIKRKQWVLLLTQRDFLCREVNMCWNSVSTASNTAVRFAIKWEGQREGGNWEDPRRAKSYSQVVEIHQNEKAKLVFRWRERQEKSHANSRTWTEQLESSDCQLPGEFLKTCSWLVIYGRRAGGRKKKRLNLQG